MPESNGLVMIEVGKCPQPDCDGKTETADGLDHAWCARGHEAVRYKLIDTYAMDAREAWER